MNPRPNAARRPRATVLIVDSDAEARDAMRAQLEREGYECASAAGMAEALAACEKGAFDLLVAGLPLADGTGPDLVRVLQARRAKPAVVALAPEDRRKEAVRCVQAGALACAPRPLSPYGLSLLVAGALERRRLALAEERRQEDLEYERQALESDIQIARGVQDHLLPQVPADDGPFEMAVRYRPARKVAGDFYDIIPFPMDRTALVIGDVVGKGLGAALHMAGVLGCLRAVAHLHPSAHDLVFYANDVLSGVWRDETFVTACMVILDRRREVFTMYNAGHNPPYLYNEISGGLERLSVAEGFPLGVVDEATFDCVERPLLPGETIILYTDGLPEAINPDGDLFGYATIEEIILSHQGAAEDLAAALLAAVDAFTQGRRQSDDQTLVLLRHAPDEDWRRGVTTESLERR